MARIPSGRRANGGAECRREGISRGQLWRRRTRGAAAGRGTPARTGTGRITARGGISPRRSRGARAGGGGGARAGGGGSRARGGRGESSRGATGRRGAHGGEASP